MKNSTVTFRQILICLLIILTAVIHSQTAKSQSMRIDSSGNYVMVHKAKSEDKPTGKTLTLQDGQKLPIMISKNGKLYVIRTSKKTNRPYKQYLTAL